MKKLVKKIPEIRNEFIYGKKSLYNDDGFVIGVSEDDSPYCIGAVRNGFSVEVASRLFSDMEDFAKYCFNRSHSAAYGFMAYRTAWLSYYHPVEWAVACMTIDSTDGNAKDKINSTLNACKKRQIKVLAPDVNKSNEGFSVEKVGEEKVVRYGLLGVSYVGSKVIKALKGVIEKDGEFDSFDGFLDRVFKNNETLREVVGLNDKGKFANPFSKRNVEPLIKVGAFDSLEENRFKLLNRYAEFRKDKNHETIVESEYKLKHKLEYELEILGSYVSQHPLDNEKVFPYVDLDLVADDKKVKVAGIFKGIDRCKSKNNKVYYKMTLELKDGKLIKVTVFDRVYQKNPESIAGLQGKKAKEGKEIIIVEGKWSSKWGITAGKINRIINKSEMKADEQNIPEPSNDIPQLGVRPNPIEGLMTEIGG